MIQKKAQETKVVVVILNWNGKEFLNDCLSAMSNQSYQNFKVLFVDNCSTDGSLEYVKDHFSWVECIKTNYNRGCAGGNNFGINHSSSEYVAILNADTKVDKNWLKELVTSIESDKRIGMVACKALFFDTKTIDTIGIKICKSGLFSDIKDDFKVEVIH